MILYRTILGNHPFHVAFNGIGAGQEGGRWNPTGVETIYCSYAKQVSFAEKGYWSILKKRARLYTPIPGDNDRDIRRDLINVKHRLFTVEVNDRNLNLLDLTTDKLLADALENFSLPSTSIASGRKDLWPDIPGGWTVKVGALAYRSNFDGLKVISARSDDAPNVVLFRSRVSDEDIRLVSELECSFSALDENEKKLTSLRQGMSNQKVLVESGTESELVSVHIFP